MIRRSSSATDATRFASSKLETSTASGMEHLWSQAGATGGNQSQTRLSQQRLNQAI
jgi:hypothetical protein